MHEHITGHIFGKKSMKRQRSKQIFLWFVIFWALQLKIFCIYPDKVIIWIQIIWKYYNKKNC